MYNIQFLTLALTGLVFIAVGWLQFTFPPKKINSWYGYRTSSSKANQERWDFAQRYSAKEMMKTGGVLAAASLIGFLFQPESNGANLFGLGIILLSVFVLVIRVEKAIKNRFEKKDV